MMNNMQSHEDVRNVDISDGLLLSLLDYVGLCDFT